MEFNQQLYKKRQRSNAIGLTLSLGAMVLGLFVLLWILSVLLTNGFAALDWNMFTQSTPAPGSEGGGLANAIVGSLMMVGFTVLVSTPIGVLAGVYLAEYSGQSKTAELTRFVTDIMLSAPSIVLGLFVFEDAATAALREQLGFKPGGKIYAEVKDGSLVLTSPARHYAKLREYFDQHLPATPGRSLVDEFIAERRAEAAREERG